jgi:lipid A disaccharide synthetase
MKREGLVSEFPMEDIAVMGVAELLPHLVRIWVRLLLMIVVTNSIFSLSLHVCSQRDGLLGIDVM